MIAATLVLLLGILVTLVIIVVNGFFVAQEFAYMSVDRSRLKARAEVGDALAKNALRVTGRTSFMLSGAQLGITVTGLLVGYVAEPLIGESLGTLLGGIGVPAAVSVAVGTVLALVLATIVQMIFGELYPKNLAIASPEPLARRLARPTLVYLGAFGWLIWIFDRAAAGLLSLLRIEPVHDLETSATPDELRRAVLESRESGDLPEDLSLLIDRVIEFPDQDVEHAMIPRTRVDVVPRDLPLDELRRAMAEGHTRYPVIDPEGEPVGVVELSGLLRSTDADQVVADIMREPIILPTLMSLPDALAQLAETRRQMACVVDEYGGFAGILTIEDLAEELVGEITDEHDDRPQEEAVAVGEDAWVMDGDVHVDELRRAIGHDLPDDDVETLAGLVIAERGSLPKVLERITILLPGEATDLVSDERIQRSLEVEVLEIDHHVPSRLRVVLVEAPVDETEGEPA